MYRFVGILGILTMLGLAWIFSTNRRSIRYKTVAWGLGLQIAFAFLVMRWQYGPLIFRAARRGRELAARLRVLRIELRLRRSRPEKLLAGFIFAFQALPTIIFIAAFFALLYYFGIMQMIVKVAARIMTTLMGASGAESLNVAASIFMGQTEAPLTIRPFLPEMTHSELMTVMTSGMAHVSGGMMAAYILFGIKAEHLLAAVIMTAPGTILIAKMLVPETETPLTAGRVEMAQIETDANALGAIARGTVDGLHLALNVAAMLISFIALIYLVDGFFGGVARFPRAARHRMVSLERRADFRLAVFAGGVGDRHSLA